MTPERFRKVERLAILVLEQSESQRTDFLDKACSGDCELRREVESLLASDAKAGHFLADPAAQLVAERLIPAAVGRYLVERELGSGGMGLVYAAYDPELRRKVAIKLVRSVHLGRTDPSSGRARLLREAQAMAQLTHPNVVAIHDVGTFEDQVFIAMEYVEGSTLTEWLSARPRGWREIVDVFAQCGRGLCAAHAKNIVHRDFKPDNVWVGEDGRARVLDFGLARATREAAKEQQSLAAAPAGEDRPSPRVPFLGTTVTIPGAFLGTPPYMAPEQLSGESGDARSDQFSFCVALYYALYGELPFNGETVASLLQQMERGSITEPPGSTRVPPWLRRVLLRGLSPDRAERYDSMDALLEALTPRARITRRHVLGLAALGIAAIGFVLVVRPRAVDSTSIAVLPLKTLSRNAGQGYLVGEQPPRRITRLTTLPGLEDSPTWSPDGRAIAFASDSAGKLGIYVQQIGAQKAILWSDSQNDEAQPAWSPDGTRIAFVSSNDPDPNPPSLDRPFRYLSDAGMSRWNRWHPFFSGRNGNIWTKPVAGGTARLIAREAYYPSWSPDSKELIYVAWRNGMWGLWVQEVDAQTVPRPIPVDTSPSQFKWLIAHPAWSPDGKWIAFTRGGDDSLRVCVVPSGRNHPHKGTCTDAQAFMPSWSPDGEWLFFSSDRGGAINVWAARFESTQLRPVHQLTVGSSDDLYARPDSSGKRLAYSTLHLDSDLWEFDLDSAQAVPLINETALEGNGSPSPDGSLLAFSSNRLGGNHLWLLDRRTGALTQVSNTAIPNPSIPRYFLWSPDGRHLFYWTSTYTPSEQRTTVWRYEVGSGTSQRIAEERTGNYLCLCGGNQKLIGDLRDLDGIQLSLAPDLPARVGADSVNVAICSPDCSSIAVEAVRGKDRDLWIVPFGRGPARQMTSGPSDDAHPAWSPDSRLLYFIRDHRDIYVVPRTGGNAEPVTNYRSPSIVVDYPAVSGDGKKIVFTRLVRSGDIYVVEYAQD